MSTSYPDISLMMLNLARYARYRKSFSTASLSLDLESGVRGFQKRISKPSDNFPQTLSEPDGGVAHRWY
jgi:hypothetical protein